MRRMLINAQRAQELRLAIVSDGTLDEYQVAVAAAGLSRGNVYRGVVASVHSGMDAAFIEYGVPKHGLLAGHDVVTAARHRSVGDGKKGGRIEQILERGKTVVVQVTKEPAGAKGAALTTNLSLAGRYLVLTPFDDSRGISRKVEDDAVRTKLRALTDGLTVPEGCGFIVRTNAIDQNKVALNRDLNALLRVWKQIRSEAGKGKGLRLLYSDQDLIVQAVRDYLDSSIDEVLVDDDHAFEQARTVMRSFMPRAKTKLVRYSERLPLFSKFGLEAQIEGIFKPRVELPSGGSLVIEGTEALTAIDVNSGRSKRSGGEEENAFRTNMEAAPEVARQLRLRDIGGLIVVDFIDMRSRKHRREVEKAVREALKTDRARTYPGRISDNGLMEINRQRIGAPLETRTHRACPTCGGQGTIPSPETVSISLLRRIEERSAVGGISGVRISLHPELADALQNTYRFELSSLEQEFGTHIEIVAASSLHRSEEQVEWIEGEPAPVAAGHPAPLPSMVEPLAGEGDGGAPREEIPAEAKSRRRRRGGRKHKKKASGDEPEDGATLGEGHPSADTEEYSPAADLEPPMSADTVDLTASDEDEPADTPRRRPSRRRGGRRRKKRPTTPDVTEAEPEQEAEANVPAESNGLTEEAPGSRSRSSRRRRRRRSPRATSATPAEESE